MTLTPTGLVLANLRSRPLRAWLTIVGIVIGVAAIIALITISFGLRNAITTQFEAFGTNRIMIMPKGFVIPGTSSGLTADDAERLDKNHVTEYAIPYLMDMTQITYKGDTAAGYLMGVPAKYAERMLDDFDMDMEEGRPLQSQDVSAAIIGPLLGDSLFERDIRVNDVLYLDDHKVRVVGIFEPIGNPEDDSSMMIPMDLAREVFDEDESVSYIDLTVKDGISIDDAVKAVEKDLDRAHDAEDYMVLTPDQLLEQFGSILTVIEVVIVGIAAISLLVGGVGIMNSMFTSVLERTKEIGILKAVGAGRKHIMALFIAEAAVVALVGGIIGILFGLGLSYLIQLAAMASDWSGMLRITIEPWLVLFGLGFALVTGVLSGLLPAVQAAKLQPVDALRK